MIPVPTSMTPGTGACALRASTPTAQRRFDDFRTRLGPHLERLRLLDVNCRPLDPQP